jgi:hypothetical protein
MVTSRVWLALASSAVLLFGGPAAASAATVNVTGKGLVRFQTARSAEVIGVTVNAPGRIRLVDVDNPSVRFFKPKCIKRSRKPCVRRDRRTGDWIVLRPVRFIYDGQGFIMRITSKRGFRVTISGVGQLKLNGRGTYVLDGVAHAYNGNLPPIRLRRH